MSSPLLLRSPPGAAASSWLAAEMVIDRRFLCAQSIARRRATFSSPPSGATGRGHGRGGERGGTIMACVSVPGPFASCEEAVGRGRGGETSDPDGTRLPLPRGLRGDSMPRHVAIIMDGNSRWAKARGLSPSAGHEAGYRALRQIVDLSASWGIRALTVFAFSSENWLRPQAEVDFLMTLFEALLKENLEDFLSRGIRLYVIGDSSKLPESLQELAKEVEEATKHNDHLEFILAVSYSGRNDIVEACQKIAVKVRDGVLKPEDITESSVAEELSTSSTGNFPYPDLLIRTSGELRLSNFLLWQSAYAELFFTDTLWPDFGEADYVEALLSFQQRQRRFGKRNFRT